MLPSLNRPFSMVLIHPQIPPNTGNIARLCAVTGSRLQLIEPLGFSIADKDLRRAGLDYWDQVVAEIHPDVETWEASAPFPRVHLFTANGAKTLWEADFQPGDQLVFGSEQVGLPKDLVERRRLHTVSIPQVSGMRSLNLSTAAGIALYEALRQTMAVASKPG